MGFMTEIILLKLGGSLITDKTRPYTPRLDVLDDLAQQIGTALQTNPGLSLVLGHGSGSFGHTAAKQYHTRDGLTDPTAQQSARYWQSCWGPVGPGWTSTSP